MYPKAELTNIPGIFQEYSKELGAKPPISNNISIIFLEYLPIQPWGALEYMPGVPEFPLAQGPSIGAPASAPCGEGQSAPHQVSPIIIMGTLRAQGP